jgi:hypothetical protein
VQFKNFDLLGQALLESAYPYSLSCLQHSMNFLAHGALEGAAATAVPKVVADSLFASLDENKDKLLDTAEMTVLVEKNLGLDAERAEAALLLMDKGAELEK